ncbi:MAG TPA: flagellar assembly protein A [Desulfobacteraceae bacterium]|nr:flagellar assembly protein A [Desulfobacteraceae bacterium]
MGDEAKHRVVVVESDERLKSQIEKVLTSQGMDVIGETTAAGAIEILERSRKDPFALVVSSYRMPAMKGDEILERVGQVSPDTQRVLIAEASDLDTMINAVNSAKIHACFLLPLDEVDFAARVKQCCDQFDSIRQIDSLHRVTKRQNKQMFKLAEEMKKKGADSKAKIEKRKKRVRILAVEQKKSLENGKELFSLESFMKNKELEFAPESFARVFSHSAEGIKKILQRAAGFDNLGIEEMDPWEIVNNPQADSSFSRLASEILPLAFTAMENTMGTSGMDERNASMDECLELSLSDDRLKAFLKIVKYDAKLLKTADVKTFLHEKGVQYGVVEDRIIQVWLSDTAKHGPAFAVAEGKAPVVPRNAQITYSFSTDYLQAGTVNSDGSIDFKERGDVPFVEKGELLASKVPVVEGASGMDVLGREISVPEPEDLVFAAGTGTVLSEDGVTIYADADGQPHLDAMGKVSVFSDLTIEGDVGFETGNIKFEGNVVVQGVVREGFAVKGASLTASQVEGADIDLTGDLNVSSGIIDARLIKVQGTVQAKYVNNSKIDAFGDLVVQKEIIDSDIRLSGACVNSRGTILSSKISAKRGLDTGQIGTEVSGTSTIRVGVDDHLNGLLAKVDAKLDSNREAMEVVKGKTFDLEAEDQKLNELVTRQAHVQDRTQLELKEIKNKVADLETSGNTGSLQRIRKTIEEMGSRIKQAENSITKAFARQDEIAVELGRQKDELRRLEQSNRDLVFEKKGLREFGEKHPPLARVTVNKKVMPETRIFGPNASVVIRHPGGRCVITEIERGEEDGSGPLYHEMAISNS